MVTIPRPLPDHATRPEIHRTRYRSYVRLALIEGGIVALLLVVVIIMNASPPPRDRYYISTFAGDVIDVTPLSLPHLSDGEAAVVALDRVRNALTVPIGGWPAVEAGMRPMFSDGGWTQFIEMMQATQLRTAIDRQLSLATVWQNAVVVSSAAAGPVWQWQVQCEMAITIGGSTTSVLPVLVTLSRMPQLDAPQGALVTGVQLLAAG